MRGKRRSGAGGVSTTKRTIVKLSTSLYHSLSVLLHLSIALHRLLSPQGKRILRSSIRARGSKQTKRTYPRKKREEEDTLSISPSVCIFRSFFPAIPLRFSPIYTHPQRVRPVSLFFLNPFFTFIRETTFQPWTHLKTLEKQTTQSMHACDVCVCVCR